MKEKKKQQYYRIFYDNFQRSFYSIISETLVTIFYFFSIYFILYTDDRINRDGQFSFSPFTFSSPFFFFQLLTPSSYEPANFFMSRPKR